ncbi:BMP family lipoprotein [Proteocatella sphenisci]|uniref:BMP family lipoprotein n=1 Tax=Proteocatella sphenisci TaxID=181070 RepID=UPI00048BAFCC|nr:BMP family ABC transporter substrate-binding protein [Proteocatella sphenisci]
MKKLLSLMLVMVLGISVLTGCSGGSDSGSNTYELALITDVGTIDDKSFNQGAWEGLVEYATENDITHKYYQPSEKTTDAYLSSIDLAVKAGAKVIVTPGYLFEPAVFKAQDTYPDVKFILLDGTPQDGTYTEFKLNDNVYSVFYAEEQAGFLAGYAAVKEGDTKLGFMGGMAVPAVVRFGYGFVQGAEYAAKEMGITGLEVKYNYTGDFKATPEVQSKAASWYQGGTEVIFACGGAVGNSVMAAAEASDGKVIGVDVDQSPESATVITSAMKMLGQSVYDAIAAYYGDSFPGGVSATLGADVDGVGLPMETSKFEVFTQADYDAIYAKLVAGEISMMKDKDGEKEVKLSDIPVSAVKVEEIA